jgi:hypothetical protein
MVILASGQDTRASSVNDCLRRAGNGIRLPQVAADRRAGRFRVFVPEPKGNLPNRKLVACSRAGYFGRF